MSVPVSLDRLREEMTRFGSTPYLLTVTGDQRSHAVSVHVTWDGEGEDAGLVAETGRGTAANAAARSMVTLLWPPYEPDGYSLIVDGTAEVGDKVTVRPKTAVLHRTASAPGAKVSAETCCANDCVPL